MVCSIRSFNIFQYISIYLIVYFTLHLQLVSYTIPSLLGHTTYIQTTANSLPSQCVWFSLIEYLKQNLSSSSIQLNFVSSVLFAPIFVKLSQIQKKKKFCSKLKISANFDQEFII